MVPPLPGVFLAPVTQLRSFRVITPRSRPSKTTVESTFARIRSELGEVNALLYNAGSGVFGDVETITLNQSLSRVLS
jgi:hypothetical protein